MKPLLGLVMIVRNEACRIATTLSSYGSFIDDLTILDTGSTDGTQDIVRSFISSFGRGELQEAPFVNFSAARNRLLNLHGERTEFVIMANVDQITGGHQLRDFLEGERNTDRNAFRVRHTPGHYYLTSVFRTSGKWRYRGRTHEVAVGENLGGIIPLVSLNRDRAARTPEQWNERWERDIKLLALDIADSPTNSRARFYIAQTHECLGNLSMANAYYALRSTMPGYVDETYEAKFRFARTMIISDESIKITAFLDAHSFAPSRAEPLYAIAEIYHQRNDHALAYLFAHRAAVLPLPKTDLFIDEDVYAWKAADMVATHAYYLRDIDPGAMLVGGFYANKAKLARPDDVRLAKNLSFYS